MKIAQISPLIESVPPRLYGGTERVVAYLTEELVRQVMIEAMACGTPVLAFNCGSVPEVIDQGVTGIVVDTVREAIGALNAVLALDQRRIRRRFEQRFTARRMASDYVRLYELQMAARTSAPITTTRRSRPILKVVQGRAEPPPLTVSVADRT